MSPILIPCAAMNAFSASSSGPTSNVSTVASAARNLPSSSFDWGGATRLAIDAERHPVGRGLVAADARLVEAQDDHAALGERLGEQLRAAVLAGQERAVPVAIGRPAARHQRDGAIATRCRRPHDRSGHGVPSSVERDFFARDLERRRRVDGDRRGCRGCGHGPRCSLTAARGCETERRDDGSARRAIHFAEPVSPAGASAAGAAGFAPTLICSGPTRSCAAFAHLPMRSLSTLLGPPRTWMMHFVSSS